MIKYGIGRNYLPDWGYQEALREIYQNFIDFGEFDEEIEDVKHSDGNIKHITLSNKFVTKDFHFLKLGESGNRDNANAVGQHGEGLKMALLVFLRSGLYVTINTHNQEFTPKFYKDVYLGECFGLHNSTAGRGLTNCNFRIRFKIPTEALEKFKGNQLNPDDVIYSCQYGDLINKNPGDIYVGGTYVTNMKSIKRAYNFNPTHVNLDRDRKVPGTFDVEWTASRIMQEYPELKIEDLSERDTAYVSDIKESIADQFVPEIVDKKVVFRAGDIQAGNDLKNSLMRTPKNQKIIQKLKFKLCRKRKPQNILQDFYDKNHFGLNPEAKAEFKMIIAKSKNWKSEKSKTISLKSSETSV